MNGRDVARSGLLPPYKGGRPAERPRRPPGLPHRGDDDRAWDAWLNACRDCRHSGVAGCERMGVTEHAGGGFAGLPTGPGGCDEWAARAGGADAGQDAVSRGVAGSPAAFRSQDAQTAARGTEAATAPKSGGAG